jgi:hypothetical protein
LVGFPFGISRYSAEYPAGQIERHAPHGGTFNFHPIAYIEGMAKAKVTFKPIRIADDNWTIQADYPGSEPREITGFASKTDIDEWMNGDRKIAWLRSQGYAK